MKLNITEEQARLAAAAAPGRFNLENQSQSIEWAFRGMRTINYTEVSKRDLWAVLGAMGASPEDGEIPNQVSSYGTQTWRVANEFVGAMKFPRVGKGVYDISQLQPFSITHSPKPGPFSPDAGKSSPMTTIEVEVVSVPGVSWTPTIQVAPTNESWYSQDAELRRMALSNTNCFGSFSTASSACGKCPLARFCAPNSMDSMEEFAKALDKATSQEILDAETKAQLTHTVAKAPKAAEKEFQWPPTIKKMAGPVAMTVVCSGCGHNVEKGTTDSMYATNIPGVRDGGIYHFECAKKLV